MGQFTQTYSLSDGSVAYGSQVSYEISALGNSVNNIVNAQISSGASISDTKLAQITSASKVSATAITGFLPWASSAVHGNCRLTKSGANLILSPFNGNTIIINSVAQTIPSASVSLAPTTLTPGTTYLIYAYMNASVMTLEASTTAHATDTASGVEIKSGDATRTLVGIARIITGPAWVDTASQRFVLSWFNRQNLNGLNAFGSDRSTASTTYVELNTEIRCEFLTWSTESVFSSTNGSVYNSAQAYSDSAIAFDGTTAEAGFEVVSISGSAGVRAMLSISGYKSGLAEGYHYATLLGKVDSGTGTWSSNTNTTYAKTYLHVGIKG